MNTERGFFLNSLYKVNLFALYSATYAVFALVSRDVNAQEIGTIAKLESTYLLSKSNESHSYSQIFKKYQVLIFAKADDCGQCISESTPWIQMIRIKGLPTCLVVIDKSFRVAKYYYEAHALPFDFYSDTSRVAMQLIMDKNTPVVLMFNGAGSQIFFNNPSSDMKRFVNVLNTIDFSDDRNKD